MRYDKVATDIILLCDGTRDVLGVAEELMSLYGWTGDKAPIHEKVSSFITSQIELGNLVESDTVFRTMISTTGERGKQYPHRIVLETTTGCNLQCSHCFMGSQKKGRAIPEEICDTLLGYEGKVKEVQITGGEPLTHPQFEHIMRRLSDKFSLILMTNGTLVQKYDPKIFRSLNFVQITLYGYDKESFERTTNVDMLEDSLKGIEILSGLGLNLQVAIMLSRNNMGHLDDFVRIAVEHGARNIKVGTASPLGRAVENSEEWMISDDDVARIGKRISELHAEYEGRADIYEWKDDYTDLKGGESIFHMPRCGAGYTHMCIDPRLRLRACQFLPPEQFVLNTDIESMASGIHEDIDDRLLTLAKEIESLGFSAGSVCRLLGTVAEKAKAERL